MVQVPPDLREYIAAQAKRVPFAELERACAAMSAHYRGHERTSSLALSPQAKTAAYLATRLPATYVASHAVLSELRHRLGDVSITSLLDLGAGPGAATLAAHSLFPALAATLVEADGAFSAIARELLPGSALLAQDLRSAIDYLPHDLVVASYSLGELSPAHRMRVVDRAWQAARLALVVIEPGSPAGFAVVREARDQLLANGARMAAPCPAEGPCPILAPDWCHFAARLERTSLLRRMKHAALGYEDEKFSYVILAKTAVAPAKARIIRRPEHRPGLIQLTLCRGDAIRVEGFDRRSPAAFRGARQAQWGEEWPEQGGSPTLPG
jgi:ribosomal protein RSM22 (predicted rRNA methylase)